jgi:hypothetical protein
MVTDGRVQAMAEIADHVGHVRAALQGFLGRDVRVQGALTGPAVAGGVVEVMLNRRVEAQ